MVVDNPHTAPNAHTFDPLLLDLYSQESFDIVRGLRRGCNDYDGSRICSISTYRGGVG